MPAHRFRFALGSLLLLLLLLLAASSTACQDDEPSLHDLADALFEEVGVQATVFCECAPRWDLSYATCLDEYGYVGPATRRCMVDAFALEASGSRLYLECVLSLEREYTQCVDSRLTCGDSHALDVCDDEWVTGYRTCIDLPAVVLDALDRCW